MTKRPDDAMTKRRSDETAKRRNGETMRRRSEAPARRRSARGAQRFALLTVHLWVMCVGAILHARVARLVYGATDPKGGAVCSLCRGLELPGLNHRVEVTGGVLAEACGELLQRFFRARRVR